MDCMNITREYYARWLGVAPEELSRQGVHFQYSTERNVTQKGYGQPYDVFLWITENRIIISYGDRAADKIHQLKDKLHFAMGTEEVSKIVQEVWGIVPRGNIKFVYGSPPEIWTKSHKMTADDFALYKAFFLAYNPDCSDVSWLDEYYMDMLNIGFCYGEIISGRLVCMNDLPGMPYMENEVREIGINTLPEYRGQGLARRVCISCIHGMLQKNICPQWATASANEASFRLAYSIGFRKLADILTVTL